MRFTSLLIVATAFVMGCGESTSWPTEPKSAFPQARSFSIAADRTALLVGESAQLRAFATLIDGSVVDVSASSDWRSSDQAVFSVAPGGAARALGAGGATIGATWHSFSTSFALTAEESIRGRVLDVRTDAGLPGAEVRFSGDTQETHGTTDATGAYIIPMPAIGAFTISVDGKYQGRARVTGSAYRGDLIVDEGTCVARYGTVADARTLAPIAGASVSVAGRSALTGADGWYRIESRVPWDREPGIQHHILVRHPSGLRRAVTDRRSRSARRVAARCGSRAEVISRGGRAGQVLLEQNLD